MVCFLCMFSALFWPTQIFANILLFFFEEYNESGYFSGALSQSGIPGHTRHDPVRLRGKWKADA